MKTVIEIETLVKVSPAQAWSCWTEPEQMMAWNHASPDWHCPAASIDLRVGGRFSATMAARDGSASFEFWGNYERVEPPRHLDSSLGDGRRIWVEFRPVPGGTLVVERFEAEGENSVELQRAGWQAILEEYRRHAEARYT